MIKSTDVEWEIKWLRDYVTKIETKFSQLIKERDNALITDVIRPMKNYPDTPSLSTYIYSKYVPLNKDKALELINSWWTECEAIAKHNDEIRPKNIAIRDKIINMMLMLGLKQTDRVRKSARSSKYIDTPAAWYTAIMNQIQTGGSISHQETLKANMLAQVAKAEADRQQASAEAERLREQDLAKKRSDVTFVELCQKLELDPLTSCKDDILDSLLSKSKYLRLAHFLQENRNDWGEGPAFAERGLSEFTIDFPHDRQICDEISDLINDWGGDGRCFRDCEWNYDVIFGMVDEDLLKTYNKYFTLQ